MGIGGDFFVIRNKITIKYSNSCIKKLKTSNLRAQKFFFEKSMHKPLNEEQKQHKIGSMKKLMPKHDHVITPTLMSNNGL